MASKVYYEDQARDVLITDEQARLGSDRKVWWIRDLDKAVVAARHRFRWEIVTLAAVGGLLCAACLVATRESGFGALLVLVVAVAGGLVIASASADSYRMRVRTKKLKVYQPLESANKADIKVVVEAVNKAIKDYNRKYRLPPPRDDVPL